MTRAQSDAIWQIGLNGKVWPGRCRLATLGALVEAGLAASYFSGAYGGLRFYSLTREGKKVYRARLRKTLTRIKGSRDA